RDLIVKDDDLVVGTHGRGIWILDDVTPLRQMDEAADVVLFKPATALRVRWNTNTDTPLPPDEPTAPNPPEGAIIDYYLTAPATPWVNPGQYTVKLTVDGRTYAQPIAVKQDPRVKTPALAMQQIYTLSKAMYDEAVDAQDAARQASAMHDRIAAVLPQATGAS